MNNNIKAWESGIGLAEKVAGPAFVPSVSVASQGKANFFMSLSNLRVFTVVVEHWASSLPSTGGLRYHGSLSNHSTCALRTQKMNLSDNLWEVLWELGLGL